MVFGVVGINTNKLIIVLALFVVFIGTTDARPISYFDDIKVKYLDYQNVEHLYTNENLGKFPMYFQNGDKLYRFGKWTEIENNGITSYGFYPDRIVPKYTFQNETQLTQYQKGNSPNIFIETSWNASNIKSISDDKIDMDVFKRTTAITGVDANGWNINLTSSVVGDKIKFSFKNVNFSNITYPLILTEQTITIDNATTSGWTTNNATFSNMSWSGEAGGSLASHVVNTSGLVAYYSFGETSGTVLHNTNNENGTINTTNQGTWYGNSVLNSTLGNAGMGNALQFDGSNDYVKVLDSDSFTLGTKNFSISLDVNFSSVSGIQKLLSHWGASPGGFAITEVGGTDIYFSYSYSGGEVETPISFSPIPNRSYNIKYIREGDNLDLYIDGAKTGNTQDMLGRSILDTSEDIYICAYKGGAVLQLCNAKIDDVKIWIGYVLSASERNLSFRTYGNITFSNQTASAGKIISGMRFNVNYLNSLNNTANISVRQNGTSSWTQISTNYQNWTWANFTGWSNTDILFEGFGNGSSRMFIVSGEIDEESANLVNYIPPVPTIGTVTTGNFWVNTGWSAGSGNVTNGYNSTNGTTWVNSTATSRNTTLSAHAWQNLTIYAWNSSGTGTLNATALTNNTQIPNNAISISGVSATYSINEGETLNIDANYTDVDSDTGTFADNATQWNVNTGTGVVSWVTADGDQGTYNWQINVTDGYGSVSTQAFTVTVSDSTPAVPTGLASTTGNFYINWTWSAGTNLDDYDVQINGTDTGSDITNLYYYDTYSAHATKTISVRSHNHTLNSYSAWVNDTTTIPNNVPVQSSIGAKSVNEGQWLNFTISGTDTDSDSLACATNATKGTLSNCNFNWSIPYDGSGTYYWNFNISDSYGGIDDETITVTVNNMPLNISSSLPLSNPITTQGTGQQFNLTLNRTANVTWYMNGTQIQTNQSVTIANYTNSTAGVGTWNVTASATDGIDTVNKQWNWTINSANLVNFTFTNQSISETQIYQSSQATLIKVDVNDSDGYIFNVSVGITYNGFETNYSMSGGNDTWSYSFKSGVAGSYTISGFYATDNATGTNSTISTLSFVIVPLLTGGTPPTSTPAPTSTPRATAPIEKLQTTLISTLPQEIGTTKSGIEAVQQVVNAIERQPFERKAIAGIFILLIFMYSENMLWDRRTKR